MNVPAVVCVLRSGGDYTPEHVAHLQDGVERWWPSGVPLRFVVLTDYRQHHWHVEARPLRWPELQGWWAKVELFTPEHLDLGNMLYFDLDTVVVGDLTDVMLHAARPDALTLLRDFYRSARTNSGMMAFNASMREEAWAAWQGQPAPNRSGIPVVRHYKRDGDWIDAIWGSRATCWQDAVPDQVVSYKVHCKRLGAPPSDARVVCFHGHPRPWLVPRFWRLGE